MFQVLYHYKDHYEILTDDTYRLKLMQICMYACYTLYWSENTYTSL